MTYRENYEAWLRDFKDDAATYNELMSIASDEREIEDRFYTDLSFGTAGLRGVLGAGYRIFDTRPMYGGKMRCILYRSLKDEKENSDDTGR